MDIEETTTNRIVAVTVQAITDKLDHANGIQAGMLAMISALSHEMDVYVRVTPYVERLDDLANPDLTKWKTRCRVGVAPAVDHRGRLIFGHTAFFQEAIKNDT